MSKLLSLSPAELTAVGASGHAGAEVMLERFDAVPLDGELCEFDENGLRLVIHDHRSGERSEVPFEQVRVLTFAQDFHTAPGAVAGTDQARTYHVEFRDGGLRHGLCREVRLDAHGLHLLECGEDGSLHRLWLPLAAIERYRIGGMEGRGQPAAGDAHSTTAPVRLDRPVRDPDQLSRLLSAHSYFLTGARQRRGPNDAPRADESPPELAVRLGVPFVDLKRFRTDESVLRLLSETVVREHCVFPLMVFRDHLVVAMENPADIELIKLLHFVSGMSVEGCVAERDAIQHAVDTWYGVHEDNAALHDLEVQGSQDGGSEMSLHEIERMGKEKPVVRMVNHILADAIHRNASDIHIRPDEDEVALLFRQDGSLVPIRRFNKALLAAVVARIKIIGRMNIAERRLPQDGRARMIEGKAVVDMRISIIPTVNGESVVIRLLNVQTGLRSISEIGFNSRDAERFVDLLHKSYGMLLVTGPTGSGKSTTLYAALQEVRKQNVNIITVEDPVEYHIDGIEQIQVNTAPGFTFARALRNILRHDPDVIMVGEIRDQETAKIAVESALTGHLVLSTLHTNDAPTTVMRLIEMGVESFLVKSSLLGVLAQRLVRINCPRCIEEEPVDATMRRFLGVGEDEVFHHGAGCEACNHTGFHGRMAVYELLVMTPELRQILRPDVSADEVRERARVGGMAALTENALKLAREGRISLSEVYRVRLE
ncbi:MAG TPA: GspE/PulE family protein [Guyparkeria sp.]|nr:GspE/PulE family protein [Guyparkeria sp.]